MRSFKADLVKSAIQPEMQNRRILNAHGKECPYCNTIMRRYEKFTKPTKDHIISQATLKSTKFTATNNIVIVCVKCNRDKGNQHIIDWLSDLRYKNDPRSEFVAKFIESDVYKSVRSIPINKKDYDSYVKQIDRIKGMPVNKTLNKEGELEILINSLQKIMERAQRLLDAERAEKRRTITEETVKEVLPATAKNVRTYLRIRDYENEKVKTKDVVYVKRIFADNSIEEGFIPKGKYDQWLKFQKDYRPDVTIYVAGEYVCGPVLKFGE